VARQLGKACIIGCESLRIEPGELTCSIAGRVLREGDVLGLDASTGAIYAGELHVARTRPTELLARLGAYLQAAP
jgi:pyruvate,orthophosphate dikinase